MCLSPIFGVEELSLRPPSRIMGSSFVEDEEYIDILHDRLGAGRQDYSIGEHSTLTFQ